MLSLEWSPSSAVALFFSREMSRLWSDLGDRRLDGDLERDVAIELADRLALRASCPL